MNDNNLYRLIKHYDILQHDFELMVQFYTNKNILMLFEMV